MRDKLIELLMNIPQVNHAEAAVHGLEYVFGCVADYLIANGVTVQEWISVKERLPEKCPQPYDDMTKWCLLYTPVDGCMHIGWYTGKDYRGRDMWRTLSAMRSYQTFTKKVSHWCRLPQPPKGE